MYLNDWKEGGKEQLIRAFEIEESVLDGCNILLASYEYESYEGDAFVLYEKDGKLFEVNGSHCSCYELEEQWEPEETTKDALLKRINDGSLGQSYGDVNVYKAELLEVLSRI